MLGGRPIDTIVDEGLVCGLWGEIDGGLVGGYVGAIQAGDVGSGGSLWYWGFRCIRGMRCGSGADMSGTGGFRTLTTASLPVPRGHPTHLDAPLVALRGVPVVLDQAPVLPAPNRLANRKTVRCQFRWEQIGLCEIFAFFLCEPCDCTQLTGARALSF